MPTARYTADGGTYRVGGISFNPGDEHEVDAELAEHLEDVDEFEVGANIIDADALTYDLIETHLDGGDCPWCQEYSGENVKQHASAAHPKLWSDYKED
jgi:hypothetical protein